MKVVLKPRSKGTTWQPRKILFWKSRKIEHERLSANLSIKGTTRLQRWKMFENLKNLKSESLSTNLSREQPGCKEDKFCLKIKKTWKWMFFKKSIKGTTWPPKRAESFHQSGRGSPPVRRFAPIGVCLVFSKICFHFTKTEEICLVLVNNVRNLFRYKQKAM